MSAPRRHPWVLALYPFTRGITFVFFHDPLTPLDWGFRSLRGTEKNAVGLQRAQQLIERYQPDVIVMRDERGRPTRRSERVYRLERLIANYGEGQSFDVCWVTRGDIRACFGATGAVTRYQIAQVIAGKVHAFARYLPPPRRCWMPEDLRMSFFEAASLAMTFYCRPHADAPGAD